MGKQLFVAGFYFLTLVFSLGQNSNVSGGSVVVLASTNLQVNFRNLITNVPSSVSNVVSAEAGAYHALALTADQKVVGWVIAVMERLTSRLISPMRWQLLVVSSIPWRCVQMGRFAFGEDMDLMV